MKCIICNFQSKSPRGLSVHISTIHKISVKDYYDKYLKKINEEKCLICSKLVRFQNLNKGYNKYCSVKCAGKDKQRTTLISKSKKEWHTNKNNKKLMKNLALAQWNRPDSKIFKSLTSKDFRKKCSEVQKNIWTFEQRNKQGKIIRKTWTPERKKKQSLITTEFWKNNPELKEKLRKEMKQWKAGWMNSFIKNPSKPQIKIYEMVKELFNGYAFINFNVLKYSIDIVIPHFMVAIEYDGSYWHQDKEADYKRQNELEKEGYTFLRYVDIIPTKNQLLNDIINLEGI